MKQLDPKAVWLFFISFLLRLIPVVIPFIVVLVPMAFDRRVYISLWLSQFLPLLPVLIVILVIIVWLWAKLTYNFYRYELTDDGFKKEHGIIWKKYTTIPYDRIQNIDIYRGLLARILGVSDLQIQTAGAITRGSYGAFSEGRLPGLSKIDAEKIRSELVKRVKTSKGQGL